MGGGVFPGIRTADASTHQVPHRPGLVELVPSLDEVSSSARVTGREPTPDSPTQDALRVSLNGSSVDLSLRGLWNAPPGSLSLPVFVFQELSAAHYSLYSPPQGSNSHRAKLPTRFVAQHSAEVNHPPPTPPPSGCDL